MKNVAKVISVFILLTMLKMGTSFSMNQEELPKTHEEWYAYITSEKNKKTLHHYYFYEQSSLTVLENIAKIDQESEELSDKTLEVIQTLVQVCSVKFDK